MNTRARVAAAAFTFAAAFTAGILGGAHDYVTQTSGATLGAFALSGLSGNQLAGEGGLGGDYGPGPSPSPSPSPSSQSPTPTVGNSYTPGETPQSSTAPGPSSPDSGSSGGGDSCNGCGYGGGSPSSDSGNSNQGGSNSSNPATADSRDHQDTAASRAAEQQAQQTRDTADYAQKLSGSGSGDPTADRSASSISRSINDTFHALGNALSNLMGGPAEPTITTHPGTITGLDGKDPVYSPSTLQVGEFKTQIGPVEQNLGNDAPKNLQDALNTAATDAPPRFVTSADAQLALSILKKEDNKLLDQAAKLQERYKNKISTADSIIVANEIRKTVAGECAGDCAGTKDKSYAERVAIANVIMNRLDQAAANNTKLDIHDVLDAFDANMQAEQQRKGGVRDNKIYAKADIGTKNNRDGADALDAVLDGKLPKDMPSSVRNATHYYAKNSEKPYWANGPQTTYGPHIFSNDLTSGVTPEKVVAARTAIENGQVRAEISYYKGIDDPNSPQAAKLQSEVTRSLTVAGRDVNVVTQSNGTIDTSAQATTIARDNGGVASEESPAQTQKPAVPPQKTSLDNSDSQNIPSPADVKKFLNDRGWPADKPINGQFAYRLSNIIARAESATGMKAPSNYLSSTYRSPEEQAQIKATFTGKDLTYNGVIYHPDVNDPGYGGNLPKDKQWKAAPPGQSPHQFGQAVDTVDVSLMKDPQAKAAATAINNYIQSNTPMHNAVQSAGIDPVTGLTPISADPSQTGLERVTKDQNHVQLGGFTSKNAQPLSTNKLDGSIGAGNNETPAQDQPAKSGGLLGGLLSNVPSVADIKQKAADAASAFTPAPDTQKKLEWVSSLPSWAQNIVISIYTGKGGSTPSDTSNTGSHDSSNFFPVADRATTTISSRPAPAKIDVTTLPWWQQYQAKLNAVKKTQQKPL